jgi:hypothetical protein
MTGPVGKFDGFFSSLNQEPANPEPVAPMAAPPPAPPSAGKFDSFFSSLDGDRNAAARAATLGAVDTNPDSFAKVLNHARRLGLPADVVERNAPEVERKAKLEDAGKVLDTSPKLAGVLAEDPSIAKLAADDLDLLGVLEKSISAYFGGSKAGGVASDLARSVPAGALSGLGMGLSGLGELNDVASRTIERGMRGVGAGPIADFLNGTQLPWYANPTGVLKAPGETLKAGSEAIGVPEERQNLGTDIAGGIGQVAGQIAAAILNPAAGVGLMAGAGADQLSDRVTEAGKAGTPEGDAAIVAGAAVTAITEKIGLDFLLKRLPPALHAGIMKRLTDIFIGGSGEAAQEVAEGVLQNVVEKLTVNPNADLTAGWERDAAAAGGTGAVIRALINAALKGRAVHDRHAVAARAEQDVATLDELVKGASSSKLRERAPDAFARVMAAQTAGTPIETFYVPASAIAELYQDDSLSQDEDPLSQLDGFAEQYQEALAVGGDVEISAADYLTYIAGTDLHGKLKADVRAARDGMSLREAQEFAANPDREAEITDLVERLAIQNEGERAGGAVYDDVYAQLVASGAYTPQQARAAATLVRERYRTRAARLGGNADADALYAQDGVRISGPDDTSRILRDQSDVVIARLKSGTTVQPAKTPVLDIVRAAGGVKVGSQLEQELNAMGVNNKTHPGLFKKKGGIGDVDNFVLSEHDIFRDNGIKDSGNGYADRDGVLEALRIEAGGRGTALLTQDEREQAARLDAPVESLRERLEAAGLDPASMSHDDIKAFLNAAPAAVDEDQGALFQGIDPVSDLDNFWKWFGSSAVIDEDGAPVLAHYLTPMGEQELDERVHTDGFLFSTAPAPTDPALGQAIPVYLAIKNPASAEVYSAALDETQSVAEAVDAMKADGYDGVRVSETEWIAFSAGQAKSPKNRGGFDKSDPRILFDASARGARGSYQRARDPYGNPANLIRLTQNANLSTFLHESGHFFLFQQIDDAFDSRATPEASAAMKADLQTLLDWMGVKLDVDGASAEELHAAITRDQHEQFARGFEAYLMEGKAPSLGLRRAFDNFAAWLVRTYRKLSLIPDYKNKLSPDVRAVMDRLLATDDAIADAKASAAFRVPAALRGVLTDAEQAAISKLADQASSDARRELQGRVMKELARERKDWWKEEREKVRASVERDVAGRPVYQALNLLKTGKTADGSQMVDENDEPRIPKLDRGQLIRDYGKDIIKLLPRGITAKEGISHHVFAGMMGYADVDQMRDELMNVEPMKAVVERETDAAMHELHGDMMTDGRIAADAVELINNDRQLELIALQGRYLRRLAGDRLGKAAGRLAAEQGVQTAADDAAAVGEAGRDVEAVAGAGAPAEAVAGLQVEGVFAEAFKAEAVPVRRAQGAAKRAVRSIQTGADLAALKAVARKVIAGKPVSEATPDRYRQQAARLGRKAELAIAERDYEAAAALKDQQLINLFLAREAQEAVAKVEKAKKKFQRLNKPDSKLSSSLDADFINAAREILAPFGLARGVPDFDRAAWWERLQEADPAGVADLRAMVDGMQALLPGPADRVRTQQIAGGKVVDATQPAWQRMTVAQFRELADAVDALLTMGRNARTIELDGERVERKAAVADLAAQVAGRDNGERIGQTSAITDGDRLALTLGGWAAALERAETWARRMDGGDSNGPFTRIFIKPVFAAVHAYRDDKTARMKTLVDILEPRRKDLAGKPIKAAELGYTFANKGELLHAILHTGNESNMRKLILGGRGEGFAWGQRTADGGFDRSRWDAMIARMAADGTLTKEDFDTAQAIWDLMDSTKGPAQLAHRKMKGFYFREVEITGIDTPFGPYKGGYVPALADADMNEDGGSHTDAEAIGQIGNAAMFPTVAKGFTKSRSEYNKPLQLNLMKLPSHLDKVLKFTHLGPAIQQAARVAVDRDFKAAMFGVDPKVIDNLLVPWLHRVARQTLEVPATTEYGRTAGRVFSELRRRTGLQAMAGNVLNAAQQITGFSTALVRVKAGPLMRGVVSSTLQPKQSAAMISAKSAFMRGRMDNAAHELMGNLDDLLNNKGALGKLQESSNRHGYFLQSYMQNFMDKAIWSAGYEGAIKAGKSEADAVFEADSAVRATQGSFAPEDASNFEAQNAFGRLFTMYFSFFNGQYNLARSEYDIAVRSMGLAGAAPRLAALYVLIALIPAVAAEAIVQGARGELGDDEDDGMLDDIAELFLLSQLRYFLAAIPVVGQVGNYMLARANNKPYDDRISTSPVATSVEGAGRALFTVPDAVFGDGKASRGIRDGLNALGLLTGLPLGQLGKPLGYIADVVQGEQAADGVGQVVRGLVTGRAEPYGN